MLASTEILTFIHRWDVSAFHRLLRTHRCKPIVQSALWVSKSADGWLYPIVPAFFFCFGYQHTQVLTSTLFLGLCLERIIYLIAKNSFRRRRPANILPDFRSLVIASDEFSFPSGHTSAAFLIVTALTLIVSPLFAFGYIWAIAVAASRIILGVHFPTDTLIGALLGTTAAGFSHNYVLQL
mgnify:CR=1 FL=1|tara:strand:+ start:1108 stop:1650 length:543 start_codon:yes stop_codon:yes gene_type:complete